MKIESMNLNKIKEGYMGGLGGKTKKGKMMLLYYCKKILEKYLKVTLNFDA